MVLICSARSGGCDNNARSAGGAGIAVRRMAGRLFVSGNNVPYFIGIHIKRIVDVKHCSAGITEYGVNSLLQQTFNNNISAC